MEPLDDRDLDRMLREWNVPEAPARLRAAVFGPPQPWWRRLWTVSIRVPLPVACALVLALAAAAFTVWRRPAPAVLKPAPPQVIVETKTVEVPVVQERVVYRDRPQPSTAWKPVAELRPRIIRSGKHEN